ncbi:hypothetical protein LNV23_14075 [Paucibacter sp. DJ1R-11]|uniref:hypothetical protein n=1 Tax=Paucibacter sp. DJ1R-11 TaxID=2893556 RepID=UPI0021E3E23B|nr:hypothetical protein [Paucibacter sp. DJ1R-11]MCV2364577.1 hypothetical protein [Paucibacter sp. DJ1R-11]
MPQFLSFDGGSGPNSVYWSERLKLGWVNPRVGDWLDANRVAQGPDPYAVGNVALGWVNLEVGALVKRWLAQGVNRGFYLRSNQDWSFMFAGREYSDASLQPLLEVVTDTGTFVLPSMCNAAWSPTSTASKNTRGKFEVSKGNWCAVVQFDLSKVSGQVRTASFKLHCLELKYPGSLYVFELDPPTFRIGAGSGLVQTGIASSYPGDRGIDKHAKVLFATDFTTIDRTHWQSGSMAQGYSQEIESAANGTYVRGVIAKGALIGGDLERNVVAGDAKGVPAAVETRLFARYMVYLEKDWGSAVDANKMPGWDGRFGWWNSAGYWQSTTGNGGSPGSGKKTANSSSTGWVYEGSSMRGLGGSSSNDGNPYDSLFTVANYMYHLDQPTNYGEVFYWPGVMLSKERWFSIEHEIVMNTISGPFDALGNGVANRDGQYRVWVDGVLAWERKDLRWRRHPEMGIQGFWLDWYHGGTLAAAADMHFRMNSVVIAREYIGPRS